MEKFQYTLYTKNATAERCVWMLVHGYQMTSLYIQMSRGYPKLQFSSIVWMHYMPSYDIHQSAINSKLILPLSKVKFNILVQKKTNK